MYQADFVLTGVTDILFHADNVLEGDELKEWRGATENKNFSVPGDDRTPPWTWATYLYDDGKNVSWPSTNLARGIAGAGAQIILKRQKTFKEVSRSGMYFNSDFCKFTIGGGKEVPCGPVLEMREGTFTFPQHMAFAEKSGYKLFVKRATVGQSKHVRVRPRFSDWKISGSVTVVAPEITPEVLARMFEIAGRLGQGDWRPSCKTPGPFGMFKSSVKVSAS